MTDPYANGALFRGCGDIPARVFLLTAAWTSGGTALYLLAPATAPIVLPLCLILPLAQYWSTRGDLRVIDFSPITVMLAIAAGYSFINAIWSPARKEAFLFAGMLLLITVSAPIAVTTLRRLGNCGVIYAMAVGFCGAYFGAGAIWCFEIISQNAIHVRLMPLIPFLWPNSSRYVGGGYPEYFLNHKMVGLAVLFWPAVLTITHLVPRRARLWLWLSGLLPACIAIAASEHQTSQLALLMSGVVFAAYKLVPSVAHMMLRAAWALACLAVVPLCLAAYDAGLHKADWLGSSPRHRIVIWKATSDHVFDAPLLGHGIHSSRVISRQELAPLSPGTQFPLSVSWHSHNAFLQVWSEAGAVGAAILLMFGFLAMQSIRRTLVSAQAALFATFSACAMIAATGYSAFAPWLSASFALAAIFASLGIATTAVRSSGAKESDAQSADADLVRKGRDS
jgi:O-antigen ligase